MDNNSSPSKMFIRIVAITALTAVSLCALWWAIIPNNANHRARMAVCRSNLKQFSIAIHYYAEDYDDKMPPTANWSDVIIPYIVNMKAYVCPEAESLLCGYSCNYKLDGVNIKRITNIPDTPMLFDSAGGWNSAQDVEKAVTRHLGGYNCLFLDSHIKWIKRNKRKQ